MNLIKMQDQMHQIFLQSASSSEISTYYASVLQVAYTLSVEVFKMLNFNWQTYTDKFIYNFRKIIS